MDRAKRIAFETVDANARAIALTGDSIFYFGELGSQEYRTADLMTSLLEEEGFSVQRVFDFFTKGLVATYVFGYTLFLLLSYYVSNLEKSHDP
jgi:aminobenzoyl-glutamate utilization protein B